MLFFCLFVFVNVILQCEQLTKIHIQLNNMLCHQNIGVINFFRFILYFSLLNYSVDHYNNVIKSSQWLNPMKHEDIGCKPLASTYHILGLSGYWSASTHSLNLIILKSILQIQYSIFRKRSTS